MNKYAEQILEYLNSNSNDESKIEISTIQNCFDYDAATIRAAINILLEKKFITSKNYIRTGGIIAEGYTCYYSTTAGRDYFKDKKEKFWNNIWITLLDKVVLTIIISVVTSLVTTIVTMLFFK